MKEVNWSTKENLADAKPLAQTTHLIYLSQMGYATA